MTDGLISDREQKWYEKCARVIAILPEADRIAFLNDMLRTTGVGGRVMVTPGITALDDAERERVVAAVRTFTAFNADNDPYGEHDCAVIMIGTSCVMWKIDAYDVTWQFGSPDPADPRVTRRVLTIMLASEY